MDILEDIDQHAIDNSLDEPITEDELDKALKNTKLGKSPGPDGVLPEIVVHGGARLRAFLFSIITLLWVSEDIPADMTDPNITILFKKGDRAQCGNYRGISLLSIVGKVFADILLQRLKSLAERIYPQSQSGYRGVEGEVLSTVYLPFDSSWKKRESTKVTCTLHLLTLLKPLTRSLESFYI